MRQIVAIHGGDSFDSSDEYLKFLQNYKVESIDAFKPRKDWKSGLEDALGAECEVLLPRMPNGGNARFIEWKTWFEKMIPFLEDNVALIGHSLGGSFLAKYLASESFPKRISGLFLVAPPFTNSVEGTGEFVPGSDLSRVSAQVPNIFLYHSHDDPVVPYAEVEAFAKALPSATVRTFGDRGHFLSPDFPEILADINSL